MMRKFLRVLCAISAISFLASCVTTIPVLTKDPAGNVPSDSGVRPPSDYVGPITERPKFCTGDQWVYRRTERNLPWFRVRAEFLGYEENGSHWLRFTSLSGDWIDVHYSPDHNHRELRNRQGMIYQKHGGEYALFRFPLWIGKPAWSEQYSPGSSNAKRIISGWVSGYEKVTVPAGTFDAFALVAINHEPRSPIVAHEYNWYVPEVKRTVKYHSSEWRVSMELLDYHVTQC